MSERLRTLALQALTVVALGAIIYFGFLRSDDPGPPEGVQAPGAGPQLEADGEREREQPKERKDAQGRDGLAARDDGSRVEIVGAGAARSARSGRSPQAPRKSTDETPTEAQYLDSVALLKGKLRASD